MAGRLGAKRSHSNWKITSSAVLAYEVVAALSKSAKRRGVTAFEIPLITEVVRALPRPARFAATAVVACVIHDHFDTQRMFG